MFGTEIPWDMQTVREFWQRRVRPGQALRHGGAVHKSALGCVAFLTVSSFSPRPKRSRRQHTSTTPPKNGVLGQKAVKTLCNQAPSRHTVVPLKRKLAVTKRNPL